MELATQSGRWEKSEGEGRQEGGSGRERGRKGGGEGGERRGKGREVINRRRPTPFFVLCFGLSIKHRSEKAAKNLVVVGGGEEREG